MPISERVARLGSGVFARNDQRKQAYRRRLAAAAAPGADGSDADRALPPLLDLSLGSTDLQPPAVALEAIAAALGRPESAAYCLHAATLPFRQAASAWARRRFGAAVDPEREVLLLVGSQEGTAHLPLAVLNPGDPALLLDPYYPSHRGGLELASAETVLLRLDPAQGWRPDFAAIPPAGWDALRLMVLGFPHNPTATTGQQAWMRRWPAPSTTTSCWPTTTPTWTWPWMGRLRPCCAIPTGAAAASSSSPSPRAGAWGATASPSPSAPNP
jgi:aspartate/methionine/tyrosine aminotransferase